MLCMQAIDLQPEEPAAALHHSKHTSLRERLLRFNVAVLRVVAAACAGLPHSKQASAALPTTVWSSLRPTQSSSEDSLQSATKAYVQGHRRCKFFQLHLELL